MNFTQDDAFISYRYVKNFLDGEGLVFNPGERVEGYTNFLWIILLSILVQFGLDMMLASKILGVGSGCIAIVLLYSLSVILLQDAKRSMSRAKSRLFALFPCILLASNSAFAYWSIGGLETTFFVMAVLVSVYLYFTNQRLMVISCALSSLIRPEGVLVFGVLVLHKFLLKKDSVKNCLLHVFSFVMLLLPFAVFKILYYGDLLPNPFYAKTGFSLEYVKAGLAYFWLFLKHYGLWGVLYLIPIGFYKGLQAKGRLAVIMIYIYTLYVIVIGGDVLQAHRFFLPILPFLYFFFSFGLLRIHSMLKKKSVKFAVPLVAVIAFCFLTFFLPRSWILNVRYAEMGLNFKMIKYAQRLRQSFGTDFTLAMSTIGAISYLTEARVIDMLGLTDPYIAKHPEEIPGILSTWKEKKFNTQYLLSRDPDVIMFSTGIKPSAPAERALFLSSKFRKNYYRYYFPGRILFVVYKKKGEYLPENEVFPDARFVNLYNQVINLERDGDIQACLDTLEEILKVGPKDFAWAYEHVARCNMMMGNTGLAKEYAEKAVELDDYCTMAHILLNKVYLEEGDSTSALREKNKVFLHNPEMIQGR